MTTETAETAIGIPQPTRSRPRWIRWVHRLVHDFPGAIGALVFFCLSLTPSLLPRGWLAQAIVGGILAAIGYGLGVLAGYLVRRLTRWRPATRPLRIAWRGLAGLGGVLVVAFLYLGANWQREIHRLMGAEPPERYHSIAILSGALLIFACLVALMRLVRRFSRWLGRTLDRWLPAQTARVVGGICAALLVAGLLHGILYQGALGVASRAYRQVDRQMSPDMAAPHDPALSGGPGSLVSWASLGAKGREFVAGATPVGVLEAAGERPVVHPIRVYTGLDSAATPAEQAALAVRELERTGAFSRRVLCVVTATGTGWVDDHSIDALEYMHGGDVATVATQYSYMPSMISFLVDRRTAGQAGRELFNQVYATWSQLPEGSRPKMLVFGESLGSFGSEAAFSGTDDIRNRTDGVLWVGPPNANPLWTDFTEHRDPGTSQILPVYRNGTTVRFGAQSADLGTPASPWILPRIVYLQHASDPVVWWSPDLLLHEPDWLREPPGRDVHGDMRWYPVITFLQITADMANGTGKGVPAGHGHNYGGGEQVDAWVAVAAPPGWTQERTVRIKEAMGY